MNFGAVSRAHCAILAKMNQPPNNIPVNGGTYNADGLTVADVLSTAGAPATVAAAAPAAAATILAAADAGTHDHAPTAVEIHASAIAEIAQHFHHMWG